MYVQPSGATGFGQDFAARHVNNWGITVAAEIFASTDAYLEVHPYADPARPGCIGASYGGFMTMLLTTRTDMFGAAVSHAGISSISSDWGEGNRGFASSAASAAKSYRWNRPDIYIDESPLFAADKVVTPLLLLHGATDNSVPPGESEQMYTAVCVLGKEVEDIVARFDKHLRDDAAWWRHLWQEGE